jgi:hypothetical protein
MQYRLDEWTSLIDEDEKMRREEKNKRTLTENEFLKEITMRKWEKGREWTLVDKFSREGEKRVHAFE